VQQLCEDQVFGTFVAMLVCLGNSASDFNSFVLGKTIKVVAMYT
jgi:hypothetical protein